MSSNRPTLRCREIMRSGVGGISPDATAQQAAEKMKLEQVGFLPVLGQQGRLMGVITDRDLALRVCATNQLPADTTVLSVMSTNLVTCRPEATNEQVEKLMMARSVSRVVVTDEQDQFLGVVSLADLAQCEDPLRLAQLVRQIYTREYRASGH
jgi:CBS domain-containing protein